MRSGSLKQWFGSSYWLAVVTLLLAVLVWRGLQAPPPAYGQVPDSGAQRQQMIQELKAVNQKLAEIAELLREGGAARGEKDKGKPAVGQRP